MRKNTSISFVTEIDANIESQVRARLEGSMGLLALRDNLLFPGTVTPITVGRAKSLKALRKAEKTKQPLAVFTQKVPDIEDPVMDDLFHIGTVCRVVHLVKLPDGNHSALLQALNRVGLDSMEDTNDGYTCHVTAIPEAQTNERDNEYRITLNLIKERVFTLNNMSDNMPDEISDFISKMPLNLFFVNFVATNFQFSISQKANLMSEDTDLTRATLLLRYLNHEIEVATLRRDVEAKTQVDLNRQQREYFVNQEIKNLQAELGNSDENTNKFEDIQTLRQDASKKHWGEKQSETFEKELQKLSRINAQSPDYNVQLNYLHYF